MAEEAAIAAPKSMAREPLDLRTLKIVRMIAHQLYQKDEQGNPVEPLLSNNVSELPGDALTELEDRLTKALGENAASLPIEFVEPDKNTFYQNAITVLDPKTEAEFISASKEIAAALAEAQVPRNPPGGILLILQATLKRGTMPVAFVIKAESQSGFGRKPNVDQVEIEVIKDLFLTRRQAVYKLCALARSKAKPNSGDVAWLFDSNLTRRHARVQPADYFLRGFLNANVRQTGATDTAHFYRTVHLFANEADMSDQQRVNLMTDLHTFLSRQEITVFTVEEFQETNVPDQLKAAFHKHMVEQQVPRQGIQKDTTHIRTLIKKNAMEFTSKVRIQFPPDVNAVDVLEESGEWTTVRIKGRLKSVK